MMQSISWLILALIHILPALAFFRPATLTKLYSVEQGNPLLLLMRHRAALFLAVFIACLWAVWRPEARQLAAIITAISMLGFLWLYWRAGAPKSLRTIALVDIIGLPFLALALFGAF
ncbi:MAG: hypothetical protein EBS21_05615 [Sphingomonadaceae bacterium]|nr:hypothetical protein [Sphingomonadaceae bacterium]